MKGMDSSALLPQLKRLLTEENGSISILAAIMFVPLLGFLGLGIDLGALRMAKQQLQAAADAGALAGALELSSCGGAADCATLTTAARDALTENGLTGSTLLTNCASSASQTLTIQVNNGPCALGAANPHNGNTSYVEVVLSQWPPTYFARVLGINSVHIQTRAEAMLGATKACILTLGTAGTDLLVNGSAGFVAQNCAVYVNSSSSQALTVNGSMTAKSISIVGSYAQNAGTMSPTAVTGVTAMANPLASLAPPSFAAGSCLADPLLHNGGTVGPSAAGGTVCYNGMTLGGNVTMNAGTYIINGAFTMNGAGALTGNDVTIYLPSNASFTDNSTGGTRLIAPTSGTYNGILLFQGPSNTSPIIIAASSSGLTLDGIIYAAAAPLTLQGSATPSIYTSMVTSSVTFDEGATVKDYAILNPGSPLASGALLSQ